MAISTYTAESGKTNWRVYVNIRSKTDQSIRAQKKIMGIETRREAERIERELLRECEREIALKESQGQSWKSVMDAWIEYAPTNTPELSEPTRHDYIAALKNHTECWFQRPATSISAFDIKELFNRAKLDGKGFVFQKKMKNVIKRVFEFGMEKGMIKGIDHPPTRGLKVDKPQEKKPEILTLKEIRQLLECAKRDQHPWYPIWSMALLTGMRNGELYALQWSDVNLETKTITVAKSFNKRLYETKSTKAGYWRTVPISSELNSLLVDLKSTSKGPFVLPRPRTWMMGMQAEELRSYCEQIGLPSIRFHALRACFATQLIRSGVPAIQLQKICGWRDLKTMQRYVRMAGIETEGATEAIKLLPMNEEVEK